MRESMGILSRSIVENRRRSCVVSRQRRRQDSGIGQLACCEGCHHAVWVACHMVPNASVDAPSRGGIFHNTAIRPETHMPQFHFTGASAPVEHAVDDKARSNTTAGVGIKYEPRVAACSNGGLGKRRRIGIVFQHGRDAVELACHPIHQRKIIPASDMKASGNHAADAIHRPSKSDSNCLDLLTIAIPPCGNQPSQLGGESFPHCLCACRGVYEVGRVQQNAAIVIDDSRL